MERLDEMGWPLLVEAVPATRGSCGRNKMQGAGNVRKESILSIATAARRTGSITVVVGEKNDRIDCEHNPNTDEFRWWFNGFPAPSHKISFLLDDCQGDRP